MNPDCGWVAYNYEDGYGLRKRVAGGKEPFRFASVMYTRHPSKSWEDDSGSFENSPPLKLLEGWMRHGRHVAFRVYANRPADLPPRLQADEAVFVSRSERGGQRIRYWSEAYVEEHRRLVKFLGQRLGGSPYLAFVDIGGVGNTGGEWHFDPVDAFRDAGLDDDTAYELVETFVEMYREAFPHTPLFISYDCIGLAGRRRGEVIRLLEQRRIGVRDDGLGGWPYPRALPRERDWPLPALWGRMPVLFEAGGQGGGVYGLVKQGKDPERVLDWALRLAHPSYVNLGGAETGSEKACGDLAELVMAYGRRIGYRFVLLEAACPAVWTEHQAGVLTMRWGNRGTAPCYRDRLMECALLDEGGTEVAKWAAAPDPPTSEWKPGEELDVDVALRLPEGVAEGRYTLRIGMLFGDPRDPDAYVRIATAGADELGRYAIGIVEVRR